jgi:hypothetical protein
LSEHELLAREAATAKAAIGRAVQATRHSAAAAVDIRLWTKKRPWIALGAAAVAGLTTALLVRRGRTEPLDGAAPTVAQVNPPPPEPQKAGFAAAIANSLFDVAKAAIETAIMTGIREVAARKFDPNDHRQETDPPAA